jgi:hypothetical protein
MMAGGVTLRFSPNGWQLAHLEGKVIRVWDSITGESLGKIEGHGGILTTFAFAPNGKTLATGGMDTTAVVWDLRQQLSGPTPRAAELPARKLEAAWDDLAEESGKALEALAVLTGSPDGAVVFLGEHVKPAATDAKHEKLIKALDDDDFAVRKKSFEELKQLGRAALPALKSAMAKRQSPEVSKRVEELTAGASELPLSKDEMRELRTIEILERLGGEKAAVALLLSLAKGAEGGVVTEPARAALKRLGQEVLDKKP